MPTAVGSTTSRETAVVLPTQRCFRHWSIARLRDQVGAVSGMCRRDWMRHSGSHGSTASQTTVFYWDEIRWIQGPGHFRDGTCIDLHLGSRWGCGELRNGDESKWDCAPIEGDHPMSKLANALICGVSLQECAASIVTLQPYPAVHKGEENYHAVAPSVKVEKSNIRTCMDLLQLMRIEAD